MDNKELYMIGEQTIEMDQGAIDAFQWPKAVLEKVRDGFYVFNTISPVNITIHNVDIQVGK